MKCCLGKGELMQVAGGQRGLLLRCLSGTLWVTQGDARDYLVHQGHDFQLRAGASALVEALGPAELRLEAAPGTVASLGPLVVHQACRAAS
jgi:hypothetical protein